MLKKKYRSTITEMDVKYKQTNMAEVMDDYYNI